LRRIKGGGGGGGEELTCFGAEQEDEHVVAAEVLDGQVALLAAHRAVQTLVAVACGDATATPHRRHSVKVTASERRSMALKGAGGGWGLSLPLYSM